MHGVPVMALTATTTHDMMKSIALALGMYQCTVVKRSCDRPNIYYEVQRMQNLAEEEFEKWKELLEGIFGEIVSDLKTNGDAASKVIIFCFLKNDCALIYEYFLHKVGSQNVVNNCLQALLMIPPKNTSSVSFAVLRVDSEWSLPQ